MDWNKENLFYILSSFAYDFKAIGEFKLELKFDGWPWKTIGHLFYAIASFVHHFIAICEFKLVLQTGNAQFGLKSAIF